MIQPNYDYRAITKDIAEKRAVEQSFAHQPFGDLHLRLKVIICISLTPLILLREQCRHNRIKAANREIIRWISHVLLLISRTKNFPLNTEFETITFVNNDGITGNFVNSVTPSPEAITLRMHHSFVQLPDSDYKPRVFDPRSSFIPVSYYDYSTPLTEPIEKFYIMRQKKKKKDPSAAKSEAVKPIIYYLDNGTPEPIRSALLEGASWWNQALKQQAISMLSSKNFTEDADPMDIRYNMISWVHAVQEAGVMVHPLSIHERRNNKRTSNTWFIACKARLFNCYWFIAI